MINKNILVNDIRAGMIMASDAVGTNGQVVVPKSTVLSQRYMARLTNAGLKTISVYIPDYIATPEELEEEAPLENRLKDTKEYQDFRRELLAVAGDISEVFERLMMNPRSDIDTDGLIDKIKSFSEKYGETLHVLELLQAARDFDDSIYIHTVGVTLISIIIGIKAQFTEEQLRELILCSIFHDIGKITIPEELLNKQGRLTEDELEEIRSHTTLGYSLLTQTTLPEHVALCALYHHERFDGSGYPDGLNGQKIPFYARYVAIADVYYAMTSKRPYREDICTFDVVAGFEKDGYSKYDVAGLLPFLNCLAQSLIGSHVILNDGTDGKLIMLNERLTRPIIKVASEFVDLMKHPELEIIKVM
ncbi:MAG: HD domain-containing protein [Lachnospiraceae bacterium]|nr:HD domain-containing protein [Lachnospiraceae bacterium]